MKLILPNPLNSTSPITTSATNKTWLLLTLFLFSFPFIANSQIKKKLEAERTALSSEILLTSKFINESALSGRKANLDKYYVLKQQIKLRESLVKIVRKEVNLLDNSITRTKDATQSLQEDIAALENEFGKIMQSALRQKLTHSNWLFFLSASTFNDAFRRWTYLRQYTAYRKRQAILIRETRQRLIDKSALLETQKSQKIDLLAEQEKNVRLLKNESRDINVLLASLKRNNRKLKQHFKKKKQKQEKHQVVVESIIKKEKKNEVPAPFLKTTGSFQKNKGKLQWPVKNGFITKWHGRQAHPTIRNIEIKTNGVDIRTQKNADVQVVFNGKVTSVFSIPAGGGKSVIVKHGDYFTVYGNLDEVFVKRGMNIDKGTILGKAIVDNDSNKSELHFEVWRNKVNLNPSDWIQQKAK